MKIKLLRDSRILHKAGETIEASPAEAEFLISVQSAVMAEEKKPETETKRTAKGKTRK